MVRQRKMELKFPARGVMRSRGYWDSATLGTPYPTPWAVNVRPEGPFAGRMRGGTRPGLTKYVSAALGTEVDWMLSLDASDSSGAASRVAMMVDDTLGILEDGVVTFPLGELLTEAGEEILTEGGENILVSAGSIPGDAHLVARGYLVYGIAESEVTELNTSTGSAMQITAEEGTLPTGCTHGVVYRDRLCLAGGTNEIFMSRQSNVLDWDFGQHAKDQGRAVVFQLSESDKIGGVCTAMVSIRDNYLLCGTANDLWVLQGDPTAGGTLRNISRDVGILGRSCWCRVGDSVVFLARDGLYQVNGDGSKLTNLSEDRLPEELYDIDPTSTTVQLVYHHDDGNVWLFLGSGTHYIYDLTVGGFWPVDLNSSHDPQAVCAHDDKVLLAGSDGYLRYIGGNDDDSETLESHLLIGPLRMASAMDEALLADIQFAMSNMVDTGETTSVTVRVVTGDTAEDACEDAKSAIELHLAGSTTAAIAMARGVGTLTGGRSVTWRPRIRSPWVVIWLQSSTRWAYEWMAARIVANGRFR